MQPAPFELEIIFERYEHVRDMNVLGASDAESLTVNELLEMTDDPPDLHSINLGYDNVRGCDELRKAVASSYSGARISAENVLITVGATEAIFLALHTLLKPSDIALVCRPAYQGLYEMAEAAGAKVIPYYYREPTTADSGSGQAGFTLDVETVKRMLSGSQPPQLLVLNTPHNPTGHVLETEELRLLLTLARRSGTHVVVDEVFSGIRTGAAPNVPSAITLDPDAIIIGCLSKVYGLAGLRVGWLIGSQSFIQEARNLRFYTTLAPPKIVQTLAKIAIENRERIFNRTQANVDQNYSHVMRWLSDEKHREYFEWFPPQGGLVMLLYLKRQVNTRKFVETLAEKHSVFLVPCTNGFGMQDGYIRLGLGGNPQRFKDGLEVLDTFLLSDEWRSL